MNQIYPGSYCNSQSNAAHMTKRFACCMWRCTTSSHQSFYLILFTLFTGFLLLSANSFAQADGPIAGTVSDSLHKEPLAGVSVQIKGTRQGTSTDSKGRFTLDIP